MQTRKRAKSVTFGRKSKEKEPLKKATEEEAVPSVVEEKADKTEAVEMKESSKETSSGLSATPPKTEEETPVEAVETPSNEFVSDNPLSTTPELPKNEKEHEPVVTEAQPAAASGELSQPVETPAQPASTSEQQGEQAPSQELSSTLPPSAFTIETNEQNGQPAAQQAPGAAAEGVEPEKKRFGLYFLVVAFLAFVLGLGAMAGASYLGLVNVNFSHLPKGVQVPGFLGQKPTPTVPPPTAAPTQKPVDLTAFTITVLNGSGISGKAGDEKTQLTTAGFKVTSMGNASNSNFTKTEISAKKTVSHDFIVKLQDELQKLFDVDATIATSPDSDSTDVTVTLGQPNSQ